MIYIILAAVHLMFCLLVFFGMMFGKITLPKYIFFIVLLLPFLGALIVVILHFNIGFDPENTADLASHDATLESELYRSIAIDEKRSITTVPIEDALILNSAREKRAIIMDVLNENPREYVELLQKAGDNDDTEVVHYAVTAMVEISKENDYTLQKFDSEHNANPNDINILTEYCNFLWDCLSQKLFQGQVEVMNRELFSQLTYKKLVLCENIEDYSRLVQNELNRKNLDSAKDLLEKMKKTWPESEEYILLNIQYLASLNKGREIKKFITKINNSQIYLSTKTKEALSFWTN